MKTNINTEQRVTELEAQHKQTARDLSVMSQAMAEFLAWTQETENHGIKPGTLRSAHGIVRVGHLKTEAAALRTTLEQFGKGASVANIREALKTRIAEIDSQIAKIGDSRDTP